MTLSLRGFHNKSMLTAVLTGYFLLFTVAVSLPINTSSTQRNPNHNLNLVYESTDLESV